MFYADRFTPLKGKTERDVDFVIFRENTEGVYVGMGGTFKQGTPDEVAVQEDVNTRKGVERIIRAAFDDDFRIVERPAEGHHRLPHRDASRANAFAERECATRHTIADFLQVVDRTVRKDIRGEGVESTVVDDAVAV